jgi:uncharacterized protein YbjT (DUF2867 family)
VIDSLLSKDQQGKWQVRGITRDKSSAKAKELEKRGVELFAGNIMEPKTLKNALNGAHALFVVTNFWDRTQQGKEFEIGKGLVDIAKSANIKHFIFSSLPNVEKISNGKLDVPHFTDKAKVDEYARKSGLFCSFVGPAFYYQNFQTWFPPTKEADGSFTFTLPMNPNKPIACFDALDIGCAVVNVLNHPTQYEGKYIPLVGDNLTPPQLAQIFGECVGKTARFKSIPYDEFTKGGKESRELANMFKYFEEYGYYGPGADLSIGKKANPHLKTWAQWIKATGWNGDRL